MAERSSEKFTYGQGIDITGPAIKVVQKMGLYDETCSKTTGEGGFALFDDNSNTIARVGVGEGVTLTQDIEIMRGDLTNSSPTPPMLPTKSRTDMAALFSKYDRAKAT